MEPLENIVADVLQSDSVTKAANPIKELDNALRVLRLVLNRTPAELQLTRRENRQYISIVGRHPDLFHVTERNTVVPVLLDNSRSQGSQLRQIAGTQTASNRGVVRLSDRSLAALLATIEKIRQMVDATWTFTYPVPREVFTCVLATIDIAKKLPASIGKSSKYWPSICCLIDGFEVTPMWLRYNNPAPRFTTLSSAGNLSPSDFFYDFIGLMDSNGVKANLVLLTALVSGESNLEPFKSIERISEYLARYLPRDFVIKDGFMKVVCSSDHTGDNDPIDASPGDPPKLPIVPVPVNEPVCSQLPQWWGPTDPIDLLNFLDLRIWAYETWPECREFGVATNPGIPIDKAVEHMRETSPGLDEWAKHGRQFIGNYPGFQLRGDRLFPASPETILYPLTKLNLLVYIEDICRKFRIMAGLSTDVCESMYEIKDRSIIAPIQKRYAAKFSCFPKPKLVPLNARRMPLTVLGFLVGLLPQQDQEQLKGIFPGDTLAHHLPLISVLTSYPILTKDDIWLCV